jgi:thiol-disulfide isomerase/thioredoxin
VPTANAAARLLSLTLPDLEGKPQALSQWKGKVLVVNFWATWCPPCKEEMPEFSRLNKEFSPNGVQFVGISIDTAEKVLAFSKETPVSYPLLISNLDSLDLASDLGNRAKGLPFTIIRPAGRLPATGQTRQVRHSGSGKSHPIGVPATLTFRQIFANSGQIAVICGKLAAMTEESRSQADSADKAKGNQPCW